MSGKTLLLSLLSKMRSNITYMYDHHLNNHKNTPLRVHHVDSEDSVISSAFPSSCNRLFLDTTFFLKQNTIHHNSVKVSDPMLSTPERKNKRNGDSLSPPKNKKSINALHGFKSLQIIWSLYSHPGTPW